jgi:hypothetical protein
MRLRRWPPKVPGRLLRNGWPSGPMSFQVRVTVVENNRKPEAPCYQQVIVYRCQCGRTGPGGVWIFTGLTGTRVHERAVKNGDFPAG